jgi:hypothetical protein
MKPNRVRTQAKKEKNLGPYFEGQAPSECGHYYPDVLRICDFEVELDLFVRLTYCSECGYEVKKIPQGAVLLVPGLHGDSKPERFDAFRRSEKARLRKTALENAQWLSRQEII